MKRTSYSRFLARAAVTLLAVFSFSGANAQETLTVNDGTTTNGNVPVYGYYADAYNKCEFVQPAADLADMNGATINGVTFYASQSSVSWGSANFQVFMTEVGSTSISAFNGPGTVVYEGALSISGGTMTVNFSTPYTYNGGNLLVGVYQTATGDYVSCSWYGVSVTGASGSDYDYSSLSGCTFGQKNFLPKMTFTYEAASSDCPKPASLVASDVTAHTAVLTWESEATQFMLQYKKATAETWTTEYPEEETTYTLTGLDPETTYQARVAAHVESCGIDPATGNDIYSDWREITFTTLAACPAPTNLAVTPESIAAREATVTWEGTSDSYVVMIGQENCVFNADFETGDFSQADFTNDANHPWTVVANTHSGAYCAKSATGNNSATTALELSINLTTDMTLSFSAKVSSEANYDQAYFSIDGTDKITGISGAGNWIDYSYPLAAGTHTLRWYYTKDSSVAGNDDCFYVDDIVFIGVDSWTEYTTNNTTYTFENLTPTTPYQVKVKGNCGDEGYSQATAPVSFTTLESCPTPTGLTASDVTAHEATISWTSAANAWQICVNDDEENLIDVTETTYNFTGLAPETTYTVKVRTNCGDEYSDWTNNMTFTTEEACPMDINNVTVNYITYNKATVAWEGTHDNYQVQYRTAETSQIVVSEGSYCDDFENGLDNWTIYQVGDAGGNWSITNPSTWSGSFAAHSGSYVAVARSWNNSAFNADNWLVSPQVTIPATMSYWVMGDSGYPETYDICVSTTGNAVADFTSVVTYNTNPADWTKVTVDLSAYAGQTGYIAFHQYGYDEDFLWIDDVTIAETVTIPAGEWITVETNDLEVLITGLESNTTYEYQVRGYCADGDTWSNWTAMATFTTKVGNEDPIDLAATEISATKATLNWTGYQDSYNVQYRTKATTIASEGSFYDDFESGSLTGWTAIRSGEGTWNTDWQVVNSETLFISGPIPAHSGTNVIMGRSWSNDVAYNVDNWLITPQVTLDGSLSYWVMDDGEYHEHYDVYVSTTAFDPDYFDADTFTKIYEPGDASGEWTQHTVDLSSYAGQQGYIAFRLTDNDKDYLFIDDVAIGTIEDIPAGEWVSATTTEPTLTISGLTPETKYDWQVQGIYADEAKGTTEWVNGPNFTTQVLNTIALADDDSDAAEKNSEIITAYDGKACDVTLTGRTLYKDGLWNTICLPFDVTIEDSPLAGATAKTLSSASTSTSALYGTHIDLAFGEAVSKLEAGKPYIIKWDAAENIVAPVFEDVLIKVVPESDRTISMDNGNVKFIGYYDAMPITPADDNIFYMKAGKDEEGNDITKLVHTANDRTLRTCRAYFEFSEEAAKLMFALNGDDEATGIVDLDREATTNSGWYTVDGKKLDKQPTRKGVYIQNGRAVVIK